LRWRVIYNPKLTKLLFNGVLGILLLSAAFLGFQPQATAGQELEPQELEQEVACADFVAENDFEIYHDVEFGESATFHFCWHNTAEIEQASILIQVENFKEPFSTLPITPAKANPGDLIDLNYQIDLTERLIPPFSTIYYTWTVDYKAGGSKEFSTRSFEYVDSRIEWQRLDFASDLGRSVQIYSETQHRPIAEIALETIAKSLPEITKIIPAGNNDVSDSDLDIYLYPDVQTFQSALRLSGLDWVAGKASPEIGVIMLPIAHGTDEAAAAIDLAQQLPHELAHILIYQATGEGYSNFPSWLDEGIATSVEAIPNPNYAESLKNVTHENQLIQLSDMCMNLPIQPPEMALLGYAQSHALVNYLTAEYGTTAVQSIIKAVADGAECKEAVTQGFDNLGIKMTQEQLVQKWLGSLQPGPFEPGSSLRNGLFLILGIIGLFVVVSVILWARTDSIRTGSKFNG
jgi:hypothetical protein